MKLAWDVKQFKVTINKIDIHISPENIAPFRVMAVVEEQDTSLILKADDVIYEPVDKTPLWFDANKSELSETKTPGDVIIKSFNPMRFLAIVHDLEQTPTIREEWIESTIEKVLQNANTKGLKAISLPVLGAQYGDFKLNQFITILAHKINKNMDNKLERIWLVVPGKECKAAFDLLNKIASS